MRTWGLVVALAIALGMPARSWALSGVSGEITVQDSTIGIDDPLAVNKGGTGAATFTAHGVIMGNGTSALSVSAAGTSGQPFLSGGSSADGAYGALDISTAAVTGTLPFGKGGTGATSFTGSRCIRSNSGGTALEVASGDCATAVAPLLDFGTMMPLTANKTVFAMDGTGVDLTENIVSVPMPAATITNLRCKSSAAPGGSDTFTITARTGTCGSESDDADFVCTISASGTTCGPDTDTAVTTAGQCLSFKIVSSSTAATAAVKCSAERSA